MRILIVALCIPACVATRATVDVHRLADEAFLDPIEADTTVLIPAASEPEPEARPVAQTPANAESHPAEEGYGVDRTERPPGIELFEGDAKLTVDPEPQEGPRKGMFMSIDAGWTKDLAPVVDWPIRIAAMGFHTYGFTVDGGVSSRSYFGTWSKLDSEKGVRTVVRDPVVYYVSFGQYRRKGSLFYGYTTGITAVQADKREDVYTEFNPSYSTWVSGETKKVWSSGMGLNAFVGLADEGEYVGGIDVSYMHSQLGTYISAGVKVMVVMY